jgi:fructose-bisphosphate aldolase class II
MGTKVLDKIKPGVVFGDDLKTLFSICKSDGFAMPAVNCVGTDSVNAVLEAARKVNSPVIIQFSNGGAKFYAGKAIPCRGRKRSCIRFHSGGSAHSLYWQKPMEFLL